MGVGHIGLVHSRFQMVDYTCYTYFLEVGHKTRKPIPVDPIFNLLAPFHVWVWLGTGVSVVVAVLAFFIVAKCHGFIGALSKQEVK